MKETEDTIYVYERTLDEEKALVCSNFSDEPASVSLDEEWTAEQIVLQNEGNTFEDDELQLVPYGSVVFVK